MSRTSSDLGLDTSRAADHIVRVFESRIFSGELAHGQMLPSEREIIAEFAVSRTVAREAVTILGGKGLIETRPRFRPVVRKPDYGTIVGLLGGLVHHMLNAPGGVRQLFDLRIFTEAGLVRHAALHATERDFASLQDALDDNERNIEDSDAFYRSDKAFHAQFYSIPQNPIYPALHNAFIDWLEGAWQKMPHLPERNALNHRYHAEILERIMERDADGAEAAMRSHLQEAWTQMHEKSENA